jgi:hypothetical protein
MSEFLAISGIKKKYPDEWVLIGNPEEQNGELYGVVIFHDRDKKELVNKAAREKHSFHNTILRFTGSYPETGKRLKFTLLN